MCQQILLILISILLEEFKFLCRADCYNRVEINSASYEECITETLSKRLLLWKKGFILETQKSLDL